MKSIKILLILFSLFTMNFSLFARDALPVLVEGGEFFQNRDDFYIPSKSGIETLAISPNEKNLVVGTIDGRIKILDINSGKEIKEWKGHDGDFITSIIISPDGKSILSSGYDNNIRIWDMKTGEELKRLIGHTSIVNSIAISPNGKIVVSASVDKSIRIWDVESGKELKKIEGHTGSVNAVSISPDGQVIISVSADKSIRIWDIKSGKELKKLEGNTNPVTSVTVSSDGKIIVSASGRSIKIWDIKSGKELKKMIGHTKSVNSIIITPDGKRIISGSNDGSIKIWDTNSGKELKSLKGHTWSVLALAIYFNGKTIISGSSDESIKIWDIESGKELTHLDAHKGSVNSIAMSQDGKIMVSGLNDYSIKIWDIENEKELKSLEGHKAIITSLVVSHDGKTIISASRDNTIKIWDIQRGKLLKTLEGHLDSIKSIVLSQDNKILISGSYDSSIKIWDIQNGKLLRSLDEHLDSITSVALSYDEKVIVASSFGGKIKIWDRYTGKLCRNINAHLDPITSIVISKDNQTIVSTSYDGTIKIWDIHNGELLKSINGDIVPILSVIVSQDNKYIITSSTNGSIKIWDIHNGKLIKTIIGKAKLIIQSRKDNNIVSISRDGTICLWDIKTGEKLKEFISGKNGTWAVFDYEKKKLFRGDDGTLLYYKDGVKLTSALPKLAWYIYALWALAIFALLSLIFYSKRYKNPLVQKLSKTPKALLTLPLEQLQEAQKRLSTIDRFKNILSENNITQQRYTQATAFTTMTPNQKAKHLSQRIFAQSTPLGTDSYMMTLKDDFPLNVKNFILFFSNKESLDDMMIDIKEIPQYRSHILFVVSDSSEKQLRLYEQGAKHEKIVLPHPKEMTRLLLESDGSKVLADIFALQLALTQISPYQLGGGVKSSMFFGRAEIVSHILGRDNNNYIVIGSRQIGKSSLLKAIEREYKKSHEEVYYISLNAGNLVKGMAKALRLRAKTLDEVVSYLLQEPKPYLFLIDEADKFVQYEKAQGYETLNALRKLSEEGRANFIVAGFWELYQHAVLDYQSPLKNFGETIELGALEKEACEEMMREPMKQLGLSIKEEAIESVIDQVGQRANLIAIVCHNIIKNLGKTKKEITLQDAQEAMKERNVFELFESWRELNDDERANRLDRIIVYATVKEGKFTLKSLLDSLKERGLRVDIAEIEKSLDRLKVSYTIEQNSKGEYVYRVALFREYILRGEYEVKLEGEIESFS